MFIFLWIILYDQDRLYHMSWSVSFNGGRKTRTGCSYHPVRRIPLPKDRVLTGPTIIGFQSKELIVSAGMNLGDVDQYPTIDVTFDGADEYVLSIPASSKLNTRLKGRSRLELHQGRRGMSFEGEGARGGR